MAGATAVEGCFWASSKILTGETTANELLVRSKRKLFACANRATEDILKVRRRVVEHNLLAIVVNVGLGVDLSHLNVTPGKIAKDLCHGEGRLKP